MGIVSFAQNFEDVLLHRVFASTSYAFYVDIGAYHPVNDSVTKTFYDRGWDGINVEPGEIFEELAAARPRDKNLNIAVYDHAGTIEFEQHPGWYAGLSHVQAKEPAATEAVSDQPRVTTRMVRCDTLTNILDRYGEGRPIAFLKIDAEGSEANIIRSTDWRAIRPTVILVEATKPRSTVLDNGRWEPALLEQGYLRAYFDGINCFYVPEERADLLRHFELPVNVLDGFRRHDPQLETLQAQVTAAEAKAYGLAAELAHAGAEAASQTERNATLRQELLYSQAQFESTRQSIGSLAAAHNEAIAAIRDANDHQVAELRGQLAGLRGQVAGMHDQATGLRDQAARAHDHLTALEEDRAALHRERDTLLGLHADVRRERDALLGLRGEAMRLRQLVRELRWPGGPGALRVVLPLARLARRLARTPVPPMPSDELAAIAPASPGVPAGVPAQLPVKRRRSMAKRAAWLAYQPFRPIGRPAAWRLRSFLTRSLHDEFVQLDNKLNRIADEIARVPAPVPVPVVPVPVVPTVQVAPDPRLAELQAEIRQFGKLLEDTLLTVAMAAD